MPDNTDRQPEIVQAARRRAAAAERGEFFTQTDRADLEKRHQQSVSDKAMVAQSTAPPKRKPVPPADGKK